MLIRQGVQQLYRRGDRHNTAKVNPLPNKPVDKKEYSTYKLRPSFFFKSSFKIFVTDILANNCAEICMWRWSKLIYCPLMIETDDTKGTN